MKEKYKKFWYAEQSEETLYEVLKHATDLSSGSDELKFKMIDWPSTYQFSPARQNLLVPFKDFFKDKNILEVGAGMGAITRFLGENAKSVTAYEPSEIRAEANRIRCKDLKNVSVISKGIKEVEGLYDIVIVVGVLEYAGKMDEYKNSRYPHMEFLNDLKSHLQIKGTLIIAIENKLGLRYMVPRREDHTGVYFENFKDFPNETGIRTFSRIELLNHLQQTELPAINFYYPFPDYKLPKVILSDKNYADGSPIDAHSIFTDHSIEYFHQSLEFVDEYLLMDEFCKAEIIRDHANSFLVFASSAENSCLPDGNWVVKRYNTSRKKEWRNEITIDVNKQVIKDSQNGVLHERSQYISGKPMLFDFLIDLEKNNPLDRWINRLKRFYSFISKFDNKNPELHVNNVIENENGELIWFDQETPSKLNIKYSDDEILFRSILTLVYFFAEKIYVLDGQKSILDYTKLLYERVIEKQFDEITDVFLGYLKNEGLYQAELDGINADDVVNTKLYQWKNNIPIKFKFLNIFDKHTPEDIFKTHLEISKLGLLSFENLLNQYKLFSHSNDEKKIIITNLEKIVEEKSSEIKTYSESILKAESQITKLESINQENSSSIKQLESVINQFQLTVSNQNEEIKIYYSKFNSIKFIFKRLILLIFIRLKSYFNFHKNIV